MSTLTEKFFFKLKYIKTQFSTANFEYGLNIKLCQSHLSDSGACGLLGCGGTF